MFASSPFVSDSNFLMCIVLWQANQYHVVYGFTLDFGEIVLRIFHELPFSKLFSKIWRRLESPLLGTPYIIRPIQILAIFGKFHFIIIEKDHTMLSRGNWETNQLKTTPGIRGSGRKLLVEIVVDIDEWMVMLVVMVLQRKLTRNDAINDSQRGHWPTNLDK